MADTSTGVTVRSREWFLAKTDLVFQSLNSIDLKLEQLKAIVKKKKVAVDELKRYEASEGTSQDQSRTDSMEDLQAEVNRLTSNIRSCVDEVNTHVSTFDSERHNLYEELLSWKDLLTKDMAIFSANKLSAVPNVQPLEDQMVEAFGAATLGHFGTRFIGQGIPSVSFVPSTSKNTLAPYLEVRSQKFLELICTLFEHWDSIYKNLSELEIFMKDRGEDIKKLRNLESGVADFAEEQDINYLRKLSILGLDVAYLENAISYDVAIFDTKKSAITQQLRSLAECLNMRLNFLSCDILGRSSVELTRRGRSARPLGESSSTPTSRGRSRRRVSADLSLSPSRGGRRSHSRSSPRATTEQDQREEQNQELPRDEQPLEPPREEHQLVDQVGGGIDAANAVGALVVNAEEDPFEGLDERALLDERFLIDVDELLNDPGN